MDDNQELYFNDNENRLKLRDTQPQEIPEDQEINQGRDHILIVTVVLSILCYPKNQCSNIL